MGKSQPGCSYKVCSYKKKAYIDEWIVDYENLNYVRLKIKTKKKPACAYALQNYYRCIHNTRDWSPSKDPRRKLKLNPSATKSEKHELPFSNGSET